MGLSFMYFLGKLQDPARMYGEVFINGVESRIPYGSYVSD